MVICSIIENSDGLPELFDNIATIVGGISAIFAVYLKVAAFPFPDLWDRIFMSKEEIGKKQIYENAIYIAVLTAAITALVNWLEIYEFWFFMTIITTFAVIIYVPVQVYQLYLSKFIKLTLSGVILGIWPISLLLVAIFSEPGQINTFITVLKSFVFLVIFLFT